MSVDLVAALAAGLDAALDQWASVTPESLSSAAVVSGLEQLHAAESRLRALQCAWLAAAHATAATVEECGRPTRSWLVEEQLLSPAEASRRMRLAGGLPEAALTFEALGAGDITAEHALVVLGALPHVSDIERRASVEEALVGLAREHPPFLVARAVDEVLQGLDAEDADAAHARRFGQRGVGIDETFGGTGSLSGTLTPLVREKLRLALDGAGALTGPEDDRTQRQRWHDALGDLADFYLAHAADASPVAGERPRVVVTIDYRALMGQLEVAGSLLATGAPVGPETVRRIACDGEILPVVLGGRGEPLDVGRSARSFPTAIRRAAWLAQGGQCACPRCRRRPVDCHHLHHWSNGGPTSLSNAAWLCAFHHWLVHEGGWTMHRRPDGSLVVTGPRGQSPPAGRCRPRRRPPTHGTVMRRSRAPGISGETPATTSAGRQVLPGSTTP